VHRRDAQRLSDNERRYLCANFSPKSNPELGSLSKLWFAIIESLNGMGVDPYSLIMPRK